jgi:hypothetical protein
MALRVEDEDEPELRVGEKLRELYATSDPAGWDATGGLPRLPVRRNELQPSMDQEYLHVPSQLCDPLDEQERQLVRQCDALRVSSWTKRWPWESRSARNVGAPERSVHRGVASQLALVQKPERLLAFYGLAHLYEIGLSALLEHIGLTRRQREASEMYEGLKIVETEIGAALGVTHAAVSLRLGNARGRIARWLAPLPALQPKPYRPTTSRERHGCAWRFRGFACRVCCADLQNLGG